MPAGGFGLVDYIARCAPTMGESIAIGLRYMHILDEEMDAELADDDETGHVAWRFVVEGATPSEAIFAIHVALTRRWLPDFRPVRIELTHRPAGDPAAYERFFRAPVGFGALETRMLMTRQALTTPLPGADPRLQSILIRQAEEKLIRDPAGPPLTAQVRRTLCETLRAGGSDVEAIARRLGLTARSLQRRLREEGTTFHEVRDVVRRELAARYLESKLTIAEIAFLLGFSEASAYFRAHKRWTGETPVESRQRLAAR
jgi:AraC-like DNA-binding protein